MSANDASDKLHPDYRGRHEFKTPEENVTEVMFPDSWRLPDYVTFLHVIIDQNRFFSYGPLARFYLENDFTPRMAEAARAAGLIYETVAVDERGQIALNPSIKKVLDGETIGLFVGQGSHFEIQGCEAFNRVLYNAEARKLRTMSEGR